MFRWDFAKSAEAMLSRWAIKRICRFLLKKKKIGDYIDLEQLDVQLAEGVIHLRDLALNVDFINEKVEFQLWTLLLREINGLPASKI